MTNPGDRVRIHYTGRLEDGGTFDTSIGREPYEFVVGAQEVISGLDRAVLEMAEGESRTVVLPPEEAYGDYRDGLAEEVARERLPEGVTEGTGLRANVDGREAIVWVTELNEERAVVDANHPLAGHTLTFDVELVSVEAGR